MFKIQTLNNISRTGLEEVWQDLTGELIHLK